MRLSALLRARRRRRPRALRPHRSPATPDRVLPPPSPSVRFSILADHQRRARGPLFARALAAASWHRAARRDSFVVIPLSLPVAADMAAPRSEERREGKECVSRCNSRWSQIISKKQHVKQNRKKITL